MTPTRFVKLAGTLALIVPVALVATLHAAPESKGNAGNLEESPAWTKLQEVQELVGDWNGTGLRDRTKSWEESLHCQWELTGKEPALDLAVATEEETDQRFFEQATLSYDIAEEEYVLHARLPGNDEELEFRGVAKTSRNLILDRAEKGKAKDELDRIDLKVLNEGDRLVYSLHRRIGKSKSYRQIAQIGLNRQGTSLAAAGASGPKCIVTGGAGTMPVSHNGATYYVCCTGCKAVFDEDPEKYIARANIKP